MIKSITIINFCFLQHKMPNAAHYLNLSNPCIEWQFQIKSWTEAVASAADRPNVTHTRVDFGGTKSPSSSTMCKLNKIELIAFRFDLMQCSAYYSYEAFLVEGTHTAAHCLRKLRYKLQWQLFFDFSLFCLRSLVCAHFIELLRCRVVSICIWPLISISITSSTARWCIFNDKPICSWAQTIQMFNQFSIEQEKKQSERNFVQRKKNEFIREIEWETGSN